MTDSDTIDHLDAPDLEDVNEGVLDYWGSGHVSGPWDPDELALLTERAAAIDPDLARQLGIIRGAALAKAETQPGWWRRWLLKAGRRLGFGETSTSTEATPVGDEVEPAQVDPSLGAAPLTKGARRTRADLATRKAAIEKDLFYLDMEDLPALEAAPSDNTTELRKSQVIGLRAALIGELTAVSEALLKADRGYEAETALIRRRKKTPEAAEAHRFQAAAWTHPNGHPRCRICGDEESEGGQCAGLRERGLLKAHKLHYRRNVDGVDVSIENRKGSLRHWYDAASGEAGATKLPAPYGYARRSMGIDGDQQDVFLGPLGRTGQVEGSTVYIITTRRPPAFTEIDEQKHMVGFPSLAEAKATFLASYSNDARFIGQIDALPWAIWKQEIRATGQHGADLVHGVVLERAGLLKAKLVLHAKTPPARDLGAALERLRPALASVVEQLATLFPDVPVAGRIHDTGGPPESGGVPEDLASARLTFATGEDQQLALGRIRRSFQVSKEQDFVARPKDGAHYRGIHLVATVDGMPIEIQLRTARQTQWATYVHDVLAKIGSQTVPPELVPYLQQLSDAYAAEDAGDEAEIPECPPELARKYGTPEDLEQEEAAA